MSRNGKLLRRAIDFIHEGQRDEARPLLLAILRDDKRNELAWKWYIESLTRLDEKRAAYTKWQEADPSSRVARQGLKQLNTIYYNDRPPTPVQSSIPPASQRVSRYNFTTLITLLIVIAGTILLSAAQPLRLANQVAPISKNTANNNVNAIVENLATELDELKVTYHNLELDNEELLKLLTQAEAELNDAKMQIADLEAVEPEVVIVEKESSALTISLQTEIDRLQSIIDHSRLAPGITIQDEMVTANLKRANDLSWQLRFPYTDLVETNTLATKNRHYNEFDQVQTSENMTGQVMLYQPFVQHELFKEQMADLETQNSDYESLMEDIWTFVSQLELTSAEIKQSPQYAVETLVNGAGDIEDKAILLATLLKAAPVEWKVYFYFMDFETPNNKNAPNYIMIKVEYLGEIYYLDPAGNEMQPYNAVDGWEYHIN